tara:strand:+ start:265 stop:1503 length:1239 start_codon:yes stop_codon:yes gene_type:complete
MKKIFTFIFYFVFTVYTLEAILFLFLPQKSFSKQQVLNKRIELAKEKGINFDKRTPNQAFFDFKETNNDLEPKFFYSPIFRFSKVFNDAKKNNMIIPFRGPINSKTLSCAEEGKYHLDVSDKFGFKNANSIYQKKINTIVLGDSLAEGNCQDIQNNIPGHLIKKGFSTLNLGVIGTSVLVPIGIMREFGEITRPKNFIYLYAEQNDLDGLNWSKKDKHLMKYLNNNDYKINYLKRLDEIKNFLKEVSFETLSWNERNKNPEKPVIKPKTKLEILKENFIDILELKNIKEIVRHKILNQPYIETDLELLYLAIEKMDEEAKKYNSNFIFVYVPSSLRYFSTPSYALLDQKQQIYLKNQILIEIKKRNIQVLDLTDYFDTVKDISNYYNVGYLGHFNSKGYEKISELISLELKR